MLDLCFELRIRKYFPGGSKFWSAHRELAGHDRDGFLSDDPDLSPLNVTLMGRRFMLPDNIRAWASMTFLFQPPHSIVSKPILWLGGKSDRQR